MSLLPILPPFVAWSVCYGGNIFASMFYKTGPLALILSACALTAPFLTDVMQMRSYLCFSTIWFFLRNLEMVLEPKKAAQLPLWGRIFHVIFYADILHAKRVTSKSGSSFIFDGLLHLKSWVYAGIGYVAFLGWSSVGPEEQLQRFLLSFVVLSSSFYFLDANLRATLLMFGVQVPPLLDTDWPIQKSLAAFWRAQNKVVQPVLRKFIYVPVRKMTGLPTFAMALTFLFSGLYHAYPVFATLGFREGMLMTAFFFAQLPLVGVERYLIKYGIGSNIVGTIWMWACLMATFPIFFFSIHLIR